PVDTTGRRLRPGMTATATVIIQNRENALRLPAPALRFRPEGFEDRRAGRGPGGPAAGAGGPGTGATAAGGGDGQRRRGEGRRPGGESGARGSGQAGGESSDRPGRPGLVFVPGPDGKPAPARVRLGISDGRFVAVVERLEEGPAVIV